MWLEKLLLTSSNIGIVGLCFLNSFLMLITNAVSLDFGLGLDKIVDDPLSALCHPKVEAIFVRA